MFKERRVDNKVSETAAPVVLSKSLNSRNSSLMSLLASTKRITIDSFSSLWLVASSAKIEYFILNEVLSNYFNHFILGLWRQVGDSSTGLQVSF